MKQDEIVHGIGKKYNFVQYWLKMWQEKSLINSLQLTPLDQCLSIFGHQHHLVWKTRDNVIFLFQVFFHLNWNIVRLLGVKDTLFGTSGAFLWFLLGHHNTLFEIF